MFKIVEKRRAWWPVTFAGVTEEGRVVQNTFEMRFAIPDEDEHKEIQAAGQAISKELAGSLLSESGEADGEADTAKPSELYGAIVALVAEDWRGVADDDGTKEGKPISFTPENLKRLMKVPNVFLATMAAFRACRAGAPETRSGN